jgi:hypothetical protein
MTRPAGRFTPTPLPQKTTNGQENTKPKGITKVMAFHAARQIAPAASVDVHVSTRMTRSRNAVSISSRSSMLSPAWWNATPRLQKKKKQ